MCINSVLLALAVGGTKSNKLFLCVSLEEGAACVSYGQTNKSHVAHTAPRGIE